MHVREDVKKHDNHIKPKSYKLELLRELVVKQHALCPLEKKALENVQEPPQFS